MTDPSARPTGEAAPEAATETEAGRLEALTHDILPALVTRLRTSGLGELEVRSAGWRVRLRRELRAPEPASIGLVSRVRPDGTRDAALPGEARSPAVGYFSSRPALEEGRTVQAGDALGSVDVLGIGHDVLAPIDGVISSVSVEDEQAVEFGQVLAVIDPLAAFPLPSDADEDAGRVDA